MEWAGWGAQRAKAESTSAQAKLDSRTGQVDTRRRHRSSLGPRSQRSSGCGRSGKRRVRGYSKSEPHHMFSAVRSAGSSLPGAIFGGCGASDRLCSPTLPVSLVRERGAPGHRPRARQGASVRRAGRRTPGRQLEQREEHAEALELLRAGLDAMTEPQRVISLLRMRFLGRLPRVLDRTPHIIRGALLGVANVRVAWAPVASAWRAPQASTNVSSRRHTASR